MKVIDKDTIKNQASTIGERLMWFRKLNRLNQIEFSECVNTTQASVSQIESGKSIPDGTFFIKLINAFPAINLHWIFMGIEKPFRETNRSKRALDENEKRIKALNEYFDVMNPDNLKVMTSVEVARASMESMNMNPIKLIKKKR